MDLFSFIFHIGVVLAVYNFLWWLIMLFIKLLRGGKASSYLEIYGIKFIRYAFLCDVIYLFIQSFNSGEVGISNFFLSVLILLFYFVGRVQKKQQKINRFNFYFSGGFQNHPLAQKLENRFKIQYEILIIILALGIYLLFFFNPSLASNSIANWFVKNIQGIIDAPVFGFIFKLIGFFFLLSVVLKVINSIMALLVGEVNKPYSNHTEDNDNSFDDYIEEE